MLFERFTEETMKAIMLAKEETRRFGHVYVTTDHILVGLLLGPRNIAAKEARKLGHDCIGCGHLLLGMLSDERCLAAQSLANYGANASNMRTEAGLLRGEVKALCVEIFHLQAKKKSRSCGAVDTQHTLLLRTSGLTKRCGMNKRYVRSTSFVFISAHF
ncbi:Clp N-terminal domain superfamily [Arabidopsis thaliana x Arabidopsis arenosa]|nr:Clp N-terminal domain superfamily [Arabidopsis thaliana x Arabidopsis arenosa]